MGRDPFDALMPKKSSLIKTQNNQSYALISFINSFDNDNKGSKGLENYFGYTYWPYGLKVFS